MEAKQSIIINRPIEEVFDIATCHERCVVWRGPIIGAEKTSEGPARMGSTYRHTISFLGRTLETEPMITTWEPPHLAEFENRKSPALYHSVFALEPDEKGTKLTTGIQIQLEGFFRYIPDALVKGYMMRQHKADLENLKALMESETEIKVPA